MCTHRCFNDRLRNRYRVPLFIVENGLGALDEINDVYGHIDENGDYGQN
ncbi:hypothetical protein [Ligilactobacillus ruminis]|nr:hypothetical protein [Ligilactobacillus ruminis]